MRSVPTRQLSLFDSTCIIVGIIVGAGIFQTPPVIAASMGSAAGALVIWLVGGLLALAGALCYAELATAYPREGGDYVYLGRAYGPWAGYMFSWAQLAIIRPGDIALMAFIFGTYASKLYAPPIRWMWAGRVIYTLNWPVVYALATVVFFTALNVIGVKTGKWTQNALTVIKGAGLLAVLVLGLAGPELQRLTAQPASTQPAATQAASSAAAVTQPAPSRPAGKAAPAARQATTAATAPATQAAASQPAAQSAGLTMGGLRLALILVLFTFGGWHEMAYVAAEVKHPNRNILRALVIGTVTVTAVYVVINGAYLRGLGYEKLCSSEAVGIDTVAEVFPRIAARAVGVLVCISVLGAINGLIFTGARISYAMGAEHRTFRSLGTWNGRLGTPVWALVLQGCISAAIILLAGSFIETIIYTAPVFWLFFLGTAASVFVLRVRRPDLPRPYKVTGFPIPPIIFAGCCVFMIYSAVTWALETRPVSLLIASALLLAGVLIYVLTRGGGRQPSR